MKADVTNTVYAVTFFPLVHPQVSIDEQRKKVLEEIDEFMSEIQSGKCIKSMAAELNDVYQSFVTLVGMVLENDDEVIAFIEDGNMEHRKKIERYKVERGWS